MTERERFENWWDGADGPYADEAPKEWYYVKCSAWTAWQAAVAARPSLPASVERRAAFLGVEALRDEVARLKALLVNCRTRMALADEYLHRQKAVHTRGTSGALYDLRERAETTLSEMERYGWCAHDCLDEDSNLVVGSEAWKVAEAKVLARIDAALAPETARLSSTTPPPGAPQVGTGGDVASECQGTSDPTAADRRGEDGEAVDAAGGPS